MQIGNFLVDGVNHLRGFFVLVVRLMVTAIQIQLNMDGLDDYLKLKGLQEMNEDKHEGRGWSRDTALWIIAAVIVVGFVAWLWSKGCTEKTEIAVGLANLAGRVNSIEPAVTAQGNNLYKLNGVVSATVQGVGDFKECANDKFDFLENQVLFQGRSRGGCGCGNREFRQTSTYNLASTNVTVDETCRN